jgi:hypothetical protein
MTTTLPVTKLHQLAGGLNIEGGDPGRDLRRTGAHKIWVNLVVVLDRPLIDHQVFDEIAATNPYPLLENAIPELNEAKFFVAALTIIGYYLAHGHEMVGRPRDQRLRVRIHVHQDVTCQPLISLLKAYVSDLMANFKFELSRFELDYRSDQKWYSASPHTYESTDLLISLSQCAGLDPKLEPGSLIVPTEFIPFDLVNGHIPLAQSYRVNNDIAASSRRVVMLASPYHQYAVKLVKQYYRSANPAKHHPAKELIWDDFHATPLLQVDRLWNPRDPQELVTIISS